MCKLFVGQGQGFISISGLVKSREERIYLKTVLKLTWAESGG